MVGSFTKGQVVISVVNSQGKKEINDVRVQLTGRIFIAEFPALSNKGALTASIFSVSNPLKAIAVKTVNYSTVSQINGIEKNKTGIINDKNESNPVPNKTNMNILKILTLFGVLILLLILSIKKSGFLRGGAMIIFITAGMSIGSHNVNALNWYVSTLGGPGCGACEVAHICEGNLQSDKSSYAPGQVMTLTSDLNVTRDVGATDSDKAACSLGYESTGFDVPISGGSPTIVSVNSVSVNELGQPGGIYTTTNSKTFTAPASNGSHYLSVRALLGSETPSGNTWNSSINIQQFTFTVSTVPSVTLFFLKQKKP